jgi:LacI family transcriptional regulator
MGADYLEKTDHVRVDLLTGTMAVMEHLINAGYQRIVHATFMRHDTPQAGRRIGYVNAMLKHGLKPQFLYYAICDDQRAMARRLIQAQVAKHGHPEAIFCHSDDVALGIYRGLCDLKLRVPEDVALVGCDGIQDTEYLECPLTTLAQPVATMCATAWRFLEQRLAKPAMKQQHQVLLPQLHIRQSSVRKSPGATV